MWPRITAYQLKVAYGGELDQRRRQVRTGQPVEHVLEPQVLGVELVVGLVRVDRDIGVVEHREDVEDACCYESVAAPPGQQAVGGGSQRRVLGDHRGPGATGQQQLLCRHQVTISGGQREPAQPRQLTGQDMGRLNQRQHHASQLVRFLGIHRRLDRCAEPVVVEQVASGAGHGPDVQQQRVRGGGVHHPYPQQLEPLRQRVLAGHHDTAHAGDQPPVGQRYGQRQQVLAVATGGYGLGQRGVERVPPGRLAAQPTECIHNVGEPKAPHLQRLQCGEGAAAGPRAGQQARDHLGQHGDQRIAARVQHDGVAWTQSQCRSGCRRQEGGLRQQPGEQVAQHAVDSAQGQPDGNQREDAGE